MDDNSILSIIAITLSVVGGVITAINHHRIRSQCCGRDLSVSLDIEKTSPKKDLIEEKTPDVV
jgi:hypothetical protein